MIDHLPSIKNRVLLVSVTFNKPPMTKLDRKATNDAEVANDAHGSLKTVRRLYPKHLLDPITAVETVARSIVKRTAVPYGDTGLYLLNTTKYVEFMGALEKVRIERGQLVTVFAQNWARVMEQAEAEQGNLFDPSVYPDISDVVSQFTMRVNVMPFGDLAPTMFTDVEEEIREAVQADVEATTRVALSEAMAVPLQRLLEQVLNLHHKCVADNTRMHDGFMDDLSSLVELVRAMNLLDNPRLEAIATACERVLVVPEEHLRGKDNGNRCIMASNAKGVLNALGVPDDSLAHVATEADRRAVAADAVSSVMRGFF